jgi:hypothetical protein
VKPEELKVLAYFTKCLANRELKKYRNPCRRRCQARKNDENPPKNNK